MIITGGENVCSSAVEHAVATHPDVVQVAVIGVPDPRWGRAAHAAVVLRPGSDLSATELASFVRSRVAGFKVPKTFDFTDELPRSGGGKLQKHLFRARVFGVPTD